ncbi:MAG: hypothetical protein ABSD38_28460, partial [Syntrophorhabdales bacterium]
GQVAADSQHVGSPVDLDGGALSLIQEGLRGVVRIPGGTAHVLDSSRFRIAIMGKTGTTNEFRDALFIGSTYGSEGITVAVRIGFDDNRSLGPGETGGRVALPVFREIMLGVYGEKLIGPVPEFPAQMERSIDAYLQGYSVVPASDANRPDSEIKLQRGEIEDGKEGALQVQPEPQPGRPESDPSWSPDDNRSHDGSPTQ